MDLITDLHSPQRMRMGKGDKNTASTWAPFPLRFHIQLPLSITQCCDAVLSRARSTWFHVFLVQLHASNG